jgi:adenylate cyclase
MEAAKAKAAAEKALQLDDSFTEAHISLAVARCSVYYDWTGAGSEFRCAIALNPSYSYAHDQYGYMLAVEGRLDKTLAENRCAAELPPLSPVISGDIALTVTLQGNYTEALDEARKTLDLDPTCPS